MKRIIYILLIAFVSTATITSCTEEEVVPSTELNGGGGAADPLKRGK